MEHYRRFQSLRVKRINEVNNELKASKSLELVQGSFHARKEFQAGTCKRALVGSLETVSTCGAFA